MDVVIIFCVLVVAVFAYEVWKMARSREDARDMMRMQAQAEQEDAHRKWWEAANARDAAHRIAWEAHNDLLRARTAGDLGLVTHHYEGSYEDWKARPTLERIVETCDSTTLGLGRARISMPSWPIRQA